ncbi:hypothetical protein D3Z36_15105, partial [Lachnospiraceae bacterium]|nr:hypothetical protein [Lachnospiraceae bacterium]
MTKKKFQSVLSITTAVIMCISLLFPSVPVWAASEGMGWNTSVSQTKTVEQYDSIDGLSGEILYDTSGKRVMACGGEVRQCTENGVTKWYWFGVDDLEKAEGEEKEEGIHLYSSTDLYNWDYEGIMWDIQGAAHPKILYNAEQKQYVMWVSTFEGVSVGVSNSIKGPFTSVSDTGADHVMGFINLYEERPGTAYALYSNFSAMPGSNNSFFLAQLSSDYKKIEGTPQQIQFAGGTLENMEGGILKKDGKYYIVNAGMSQYAVAASLDSEWEVNTLKMWDGTAYKDIVSKNQTSSVFHVKTDNSDEYVCIGDSVGGETEEVRYIWLPIEFFEDGSAALRELSNWKLDGSISGGPENPVLYDSIHGLADEMLYDTEGQKIQACGGEVHQVEENGETKWYWFGEDVPGSSDDASNAVHGIHLYSSSDLYNWTREEDIFKGMSSKEQFETDEYFRTLYGDLSDSEKNMVFECLQNCPTAHPKVLYNEKKRQYVMWVPDFQGAECIAVSDSIKGPFRFVKYCESVTGFVTMYQEKNGAAYVVYQGADGLAIAKLTDDYMDVTDNAQTLTFNGETKLSSAEGAMFKQNGKYYIINAGMKQYAVSDTLAGTWSVHPLQMVSDKGQISGEEDEDYQLNPTSCILPVNTEDGVIYINISDKWDSAAADQTRYVWLPVKFSEDGTIALRELSHWKLEDIQPEEPDVSPIPGMNDSIDGLSGEILYDTAGERVYACGGEVHQVEEDGQTKWYWFGVNDLEMDGQIKQPGIHLYSSTDLYNWVHEGTMGEIGKDCLIAHPKMLYNEQKQQFVMWVELETGGMKVAVSKSIKGPFTLVDGAGNSDITGFINLFKDRDGTAYILYGSRDIYVPGSPETSKLGKVFMAKLSEDYTQVEGASWELQYTDGGTLFNSEGGIFERNGKYYIINAGNPDSDGPQYAVADSLKGPWTVHGIQMWNNEEQKFEDIVSKNQTSNVFQVKTKNEDTYICVGDSVGGEIPEQVRYIWLPVKFFEDGTVALEKLSNWRLELDRPDVEVTEVRLSEESKTLQEGEKYQINATVLPSNASN